MAALAVGLAFGCPLVAQAQTQPTPPEYYSLDARGVDLVSGRLVHGTTEVVIGQPGAGGLQYGRIYLGSGTTWRDTMIGTINRSGSVYTVSIGPVSELFNLVGSTFTPRSNNGSTLVAGSGQLLFTSSAGAVATFTSFYALALAPYEANVALLASYTAPNGERLDYHYLTGEYCIDYDPETFECILEAPAVRLQSVTNNLGYQLHYT